MSTMGVLPRLDTGFSSPSYTQKEGLDFDSPLYNNDEITSIPPAKLSPSTQQ